MSQKKWKWLRLGEGCYVLVGKIADGFTLHGADGQMLCAINEISTCSGPHLNLYHLPESLWSAWAYSERRRASDRRLIVSDWRKWAQSVSNGANLRARLLKPRDGLDKSHKSENTWSVWASAKALSSRYRSKKKEYGQWYTWAQTKASNGRHRWRQKQELRHQRFEER